jgi:hypothetical protein
VEFDGVEQRQVGMGEEFVDDHREDAGGGVVGARGSADPG